MTRRATQQRTYSAYQWHILAGLIAGFLLRLYFLRAQTHIQGDSLVYGDLATNMLKHHIYGLTEAANIRSTLIRLPGYPLLLAACFAAFGVGNYVAVLWFQLLLDLVTCCLVAALARRLMGQRAGLAALWLAMLCPFTANYIAAPLTETSAVVCAALAFYSLERWAARVREAAPLNAWLWPLALSLAFAALLRPDRLLLAFAVLSAMAWLAWNFRGGRRRAVLQTCIVALAIALPLAIWGARNWRVFHVLQPLAPKSANDPGEFVNHGFDRWYRTWAIDFKSTDDVYWSYDGSPLALTDLPGRAFDSATQREETAAIFDSYNEAGAATPQIDAAFAALAAERVAAHPFRYYVELPVLRVFDMWLRPRTEMLPLPNDWWRWRAHPLASAGTAAYAALNLVYLILAALGLYKWRQQSWSDRRALAIALLAFVLMRSAMLLTLDNSEPRYTIDCYPIVILLAAFAFVTSRTIKAQHASYAARP